MCEVGDIILINSYESDGQVIGKHSFVVINDEEGQIQGLDYNIICNVMSSFKDEAHKNKKLSFPGNFPVTSSDSTVLFGNDKDGYIKAEQFYFFNKEKTSFTVIGKMNPDVFELLIKFIKDQPNIKYIIDNL
ncbi:hypothetical protein [Intestinibacter sp.]|uniref:hypothetical protein n=1 Tax=Intestinibacter sp. TaxID=1965304 RepID=UPI003AB5DB41